MSSMVGFSFATMINVNWTEIKPLTGAQLKAVAVEAGMIALREGATIVGHEHFLR